MKKRIVESLDEFINEAKEFTTEDILKYVTKELSGRDYLKDRNEIGMFGDGIIRAKVYGKTRTAYSGNPYQIEVVFINTKTGIIYEIDEKNPYTHFIPGDKKSFVQAWGGAVTWMWDKMDRAAKRDIDAMANANLTHDAYR